ncbi:MULTISPECIES: hypothetical protein [Fusobacterium]|uniref:hypothetical protein n=1 Tax=Fusobacterium TaxID=848 RepID=UPI0004150A2D|nr:MULTISPECIES: hypothetical protein [Fusobacterium]
MKSMMLTLIIVNIVIVIICAMILIKKFVKEKGMECFYIEDEILYLNSLFIKKISLSDIEYIEFSYNRARTTYIGLIKVYKKNAKIVKRHFQTSKISFVTTEKMILEEIEKITPILKEYSIPYDIKGK